MTPISALYLNLFKSYGRLCDFDLFSDLDLDLDLSKSNHLLLWSYTIFSQNFIQIGVVLFDFSVTLTLTFDLDLSKSNHFFLSTQGNYCPNLVKIRAGRRTLERAKG